MAERWSVSKVNHLIDMRKPPYTWIGGKVTGCKDPLDWKCDKCGFELSFTPDCMFNNKKFPTCPCCGIGGKPSIEAIKYHLLYFNKKIVLISTEYSPQNNILRWKCLADGEEFSRSWSKVRAETQPYCVECARKLKIKKQPIPLSEVNDILTKIGNNVILLSKEYAKVKPTYLEWKCTVCDYTWKEYIRLVLKRKSCPECDPSSKKSYSKVKEAIETSGKIQMLTKQIDYINATQYTSTFKCLVDGCNHEWPTTPRNILKGSGCPNCAGNIQYTFEEIKEKLENKWDIVVVSQPESYTNTKSDITVRCLRHDKEYTLPYRAILNYKGCKDCKPNKGGVLYTTAGAERNKAEWIQEPFIVYIIRVYNDNEEFQKIGVTNHSVEDRFRGADMLYYYKYEILREIKTNMYDGVWLEHYLHKEFKELSYIPHKNFGGKTECFQNLPTELLERTEFRIKSKERIN